MSSIRNQMNQLQRSCSKGFMIFRLHQCCFSRQIIKELLHGTYLPAHSGTSWSSGTMLLPCPFPPQVCQAICLSLLQSEGGELVIME